MKVRFITPYYGVKGQRLLTLPCLAAEFEQYCDVELCDQNVEAVDYSDCDLVGISLLVYNAPLGYEIAQRFRERGIPVIMGGSWPTVSPDWVAPHCDSVVVGEVEGLGAEIIADLGAGQLKPRYRRNHPPCMDDLRLPRVDMLKSDRYFQLTGYPMELTRGCPNACNFCVSRDIQPIDCLRIPRAERTAITRRWTAPDEKSQREGGDPSRPSHNAHSLVRDG